MTRFPQASSAALVSAAALGAAAALLRRLLRHRAVEQAVLADRKEAGTGALPLVAAADTGSPAEALESNEPDGLPTRTWVVDNSSNWDGSPLELVVPRGNVSGNGSRPGPARNQRRAPDS